MSNKKEEKVIWIDEKTIMVNKIRFIRSWKGTKVPKEKGPKKSRCAYMKSYRERKKRQKEKLEKDLLHLQKILLEKI